MSMDLTGITNQNEYYTNHYFASIFEENAADTIAKWRAEAREQEGIRTPWALLREAARQYYPVHDRFLRSRFDTQTLTNIRTLADIYLSALGYPDAAPEWVNIDDVTRVPVYLELKKPNGAPALWVLLASSEDREASILDKFCFSAEDIGEEGLRAVSSETMTDIPNEDLVTKILFGQAEPPRFVILIGMNQIALIDRNRWNDKRYLQFELEDIFSRHEETTLQAMAVLLHRTSLCPEEGTALLDELGANSQKHAAGVSQDLKYALRECIELLGNEVLYDMAHRLGRNFDADPADAGQLTLECLRYMYRMLFVLFIEARPELGYAPIKAQAYLSGYSLESLRDIADDIRDDVNEVGDGYYLHETLSKLYDLIYNGYPKSEEEILKYSNEESLHDMFVIAPLKAHIFDPEFTPTITKARLRNRVMLRIIDLMSLTRETGKKNDRRGRISYANLGINQMGSVYEALLSYRGFIAEHTLFEVKRAGDSFNELDVGYFVTEEDLDQYTEDERVRYEKDDPDGRYKKGQLRRYEKGTFIYRLAGREREKSASYYTPEVLTKCLVKYALKELLEGKTADDILELTVCEPAMGSAAFLNEAINQLAEAYLDRKQKERGELIPADKRLMELQKIKMYIADRNVYGIDLNPVAVELAEVSLWLNTIYEGGFVPWFGTQLVNGNSLIGARRQVYSTDKLTASSKGIRWYESAPDRVPVGTARSQKKQVWHFLLGDPGMCDYTDKVIKSLEPDNIKLMKDWNKAFTAPYSKDDVTTLLRLSGFIDELWKSQVNLRREVEQKTQDTLSVYGHEDTVADSHTTIRQKDKILNELYRSEHMMNAGPYARLKFAMDYWCALWFWPIEKADLLPSRSEFFFDMTLILEGTVASIDKNTPSQISMFPNEIQQMAMEIIDEYGMDTIVDIPRLCENSPRLKLVREIAAQNHFMHWELEFADLFEERGGFDLVIGNPPWIKVKWAEFDVLSEKNPRFALQKFNAAQVKKLRAETLEQYTIKRDYLDEYASASGQLSYCNADSNYSLLKGQQSNLYKCFLPQSWYSAKENGISAFIHPDGVYDDPNGGKLRRELYPRLRKRYQFVNEKLLFPEISDTSIYGINIYSNSYTNVFEMITHCYYPSTIDESYSGVHAGEQVPEMKNKDGDWNITGHPLRIVKIGKSELVSIAKVYDDSRSPYTTRLPAIYAKELLEIIECFAKQEYKVSNMAKQMTIYMTQLLDETASQDNGIIVELPHFPESDYDLVYCGPYISISNPLFKTPRRVCKEKADYDRIDLIIVPEDYIQRTKYSIDRDISVYTNESPKTPDGIYYIDTYRIATRKMLGLNQERTLMSAIIPTGASHINGVYGMYLSDPIALVYLQGLMSSLPYDYFVRSLGKSNFLDDTAEKLPVPCGNRKKAIILRTLLLNCITSKYTILWKRVWDDIYLNDTWSRSDNRLLLNKFRNLDSKWQPSFPLKNDFERRYALIEIDVLAAQLLGMSLEQLLALYRIQFPVLKKYEEETWYDAKGRIVFTNNKSLTGVGFTRPEWENGIKGAPAGKKFYRTITDDTMPGGPVERTIEYVAPFDRCDREKDYETAWRFFERKYGKKD